MLGQCEPPREERCVPTPGVESEEQGGSIVNGTDVRSWDRRHTIAAIVTVVAVGAGLLAWSVLREDPSVIVGVPPAEARVEAPGPTIVLGPANGVPGEPPADSDLDDRPAPAQPRPEPPPAAGLALPDGEPWRPAISFTSVHPVPDELVFVLVAGSDARPGEDLRRTRADSVHLLAVNPGSGQGTIVGFPRDSYVEIPGYGQGRINSALALGGPDLLAETVRRLTGLPVDYYILTGFEGLTRMVDDLGGVDVLVERRMNDRFSGARFEPGWHRFTGAEALAFSRNRMDTEQGDFSRSEHHGVIILSALAKMRAEVADDAGVRRWIEVLLRHADLDVPLSDLPALGAVARRLAPAELDNVVVPGRVGMAGRSSVVYLTPDAARLFDDLRPDAVIGDPGPRRADAPPETTTTTIVPPTSTTTTTTSTTTPVPAVTTP